tara:strand:+ start:12832 stop:13248 length:417 start_codon:yes stop_codon:yes gene_type:complete
MSKKDYLSATTIAQSSFCENKLALEKKYGKQENDIEQIRRQRGDEEHLRHHLEAQRYGKNKDGRCFIASEVYGPVADETNVLRTFRDTVLLPKSWGRTFISVYYDISPAIAVVIRKNPLLRTPAKWVLDIVIRAVKRC